MKRCFCILTISLTLVSRHECLAYNDQYTPYNMPAYNNQQLKVMPTIKEKGEFRDKNLTISCRPTRKEYGTRIDIRYNDKLVTEINFPLSRDDLSIFEDIYYVDIDKNNLPDIVIRTTNLGSGLGTFNNHVIMFLQTESGKFRRIDFNTFYFDVRDFVDLKGDEKYELLMLSLAELKCSDGKLHSFWVYVPYEIKDFNLVIDQHISGFPKFIWYTQTPSTMPTNKLSKKQKEAYIKTLPRIIKSREIK